MGGHDGEVVAELGLVGGHRLHDTPGAGGLAAARVVDMGRRAEAAGFEPPGDGSEVGRGLGGAREVALAMDGLGRPRLDDVEEYEG